jgi:hypothetical protein
MKCKDSSIVSVLGSSVGKANQSLSYNLILEGVWVLEPSIATDEKGLDVIKVRRGKAWIRWHQVNNFSESNEKSRHYVLDSSSGLMQFGDGIHGRIPPKGGIIKATYRTSGVTEGNVGRKYP